jgi:DNA replication and repair protein RecF
VLVRSLKLTGFRNLVPTLVEPGPRFNVISGNNGQGKTNLLEALYAVCTLRSFRTSRLRDLIHIDQEQAYAAAKVETGGLERRYELTINPRSRVVRLDDKPVRPIARYFGGFNVVLFAPEDLLVARASPAERRRFLDRAVFTQDPRFLARAQDYEKVLKNRNLTLRDESLAGPKQDELLTVYDQQLAGLAAQVLHARLRYLAAMTTPFAEAFESITRSGLSTGVDYKCAGEIAPDGLELPDLEEILLEAFTSSRRADLARGATNLGPHRDVLQFRLAGQLAANFASQGQLRAMILAWKTAEMSLLAEAHEEAPILLLDDVSSELDPERNEYLFDFLRLRDNQCFITTTHPDYVLLTSDRLDYRVENGIIEVSS